MAFSDLSEGSCPSIPPVFRRAAKKIKGGLFSALIIKGGEVIFRTHYKWPPSARRGCFSIIAHTPLSHLSGLILLDF
jgi:hypothetical protein